MQRNAPGSGETEQTLDFSTDHGESGTLSLNIPESSYTSQETSELLEKTLARLDQEILGENLSFQEINQDLNLPQQLPDSPVIISWSSSRMDFLDDEGKLGMQIPAGGAEVDLEAELCLQSQKLIYQRTLQVYPKKSSSLEEKIATEATFKNADRPGNLYYLPDQVDGQIISWKKARPTQGITLFFLTLIGIGALFWADHDQKQKVQKSRQEQLMIDYPELTSKLLLLLSAGLSVRSCFERIAADYQIRRKEEDSQVHFAYEEISVSCRELKSGVPERKVYENFGSRCGCLAYKTLATILSQNLQKGSRGILELLEQEARDAFEERKRLARVRGEKAGTQLLFPMILMLTVVLIILVVPAYLSFSQ